MRIEFLAAAALACMVCAQPVWAINKCTGPDGKTVFQDTPCAGGKGQLIEVRPASGRSPLAQPEAGQDTKQRIARTETDSKIMEAINLRQPMVGMNKAQLEQAMGAPNVVRGGSHLGWSSAAPLAERGLVTVLASDYYWPALLEAALVMADRGALA